MKSSLPIKNFQFKGDKDDVAIVEAVMKEAIDDAAAADTAAAPAAPAAAAVEEEEAQCLICYDILSSKVRL